MTIDRGRHESVLFTSVCPVCAHERLQTGYRVPTLELYLSLNQTIEAYCEDCDYFWPISAREQRALAAVLASIRGERRAES